MIYDDDDDNNNNNNNNNNSHNIGHTNLKYLVIHNNTYQKLQNLEIIKSQQSQLFAEIPETPEFLIAFLKD